MINFNRSAMEFTTLRDEVNYTIRGGFGLELNYCPLCVTLLELVLVPSQEFMVLAVLTNLEEVCNEIWDQIKTE